MADVAGPGDHGMHQRQDLAAGPETPGPVGEADSGIDQGLQSQAGHQVATTTSPASATRPGSSKVTSPGQSRAILASLKVPPGSVEL